MDLTIIIVLWVIVSIVQAINDRKKTPPPIPPQDSTGNLDFEIPTLANDPNKPAEVEEINLAEIYRQKKLAAQNLESAKVQPETKNIVEEETKNIEVNITPESAMNAIILSEILDKPKALRKRR